MLPIYSLNNYEHNNIVSFCLYGSNATYIIGMKENIKLAKQHYSDWEVRIHHNSTVSEKYINQRVLNFNRMKVLNLESLLDKYHLLL